MSTVNQQDGVESLPVNEFDKFHEIMESFKRETGQYPIKQDVIRFVQPLFEIDLLGMYAKYDRKMTKWTSTNHR